MVVRRVLTTALAVLIASLGTAAPAASASEVDKRRPSTPGNLQSTGRTASSITLTWSASTDNVMVTEYQVFRQESLVGVVNELSFTDGGLQANMPYSYTVRAVDGSGNVSKPSNLLTVSTLQQSGDIVADHVGCEYRYDFDNSWYEVRITLYVSYSGSYGGGGPFDGWVKLDGNLISATLGSGTYTVTRNGPGWDDLSGVFLVDSENQLAETDENNNSVSYNGDPSSVGGEPVEFTSYPC